MCHDGVVMERSTRRTPEAAIVRQVDAELERSGHGRMSRRERQVAAYGDWLAEVRDGALCASELAEIVVEWREEPDVLAVPATDSGSVEDVEEAERARAWAVSLRVAQRAGELSEVRSFRQRHLPSGLVPWPDLERWLLDRPEPLVQVVRVLMEPGAGEEALELDDDLQPAEPAHEFRPLMGIVQSADAASVSFVGWSATMQRPDGGSAVVGMRAGPIADGDLLAQHLVQRTGWDRRQAFVWLFTGEVPALPLLTAGTWRTSQDREPWRVRITADVDVDPRAVEAAFRSVRRRADSKRAPTMTKRAWQAAAWCLRHPTGTWEARMRRFSATYPEAAFDDWRQFARTVKRASARLPLPTSWATKYPNMLRED